MTVRAAKGRSGWAKVCALKVLPFPFLALASAAVAMAVGWAARLWVLEVPAIGWRCAAEAAPPWCSLYAGFGWLLRSQVFGAVALAAAVVALLGSSRAAVLAATFAGALALVLYNAELGAAAVLLAALRAIRL